MNFNSKTRINIYHIALYFFKRGGGRWEIAWENLYVGFVRLAFWSLFLHWFFHQNKVQDLSIFTDLCNRLCCLWQPLTDLIRRRCTGMRQLSKPHTYCFVEQMLQKSPKKSFFSVTVKQALIRYLVIKKSVVVWVGLVAYVISTWRS